MSLKCLTAMYSDLLHRISPRSYSKSVKYLLKFVYSRNLKLLFISNFRRVLSVVCFLLGNSPASEFYIPTFRNTLSSIFIGRYEDGTECSETSAYKIETPENYP